LTNNYLDVNFELLLVLHIVQSRTCEAIFRGEIKDETPMVLNGNISPKIKQNLGHLNKAAWTHYIVSQDGNFK